MNINCKQHETGQLVSHDVKIIYKSPNGTTMTRPMVATATTTMTTMAKEQTTNIYTTDDIINK